MLCPAFNVALAGRPRIPPHLRWATRGDSCGGPNEVNLARVA